MKLVPKRTKLQSDQQSVVSYDIPAQHLIIDCDDVRLRFQNLVAENLPKSKRRLLLIEIFREVLSHGRTEVKNRFDANGNGTEVVRALSFFMDQLLRLIHEFAITHEYFSGAEGNHHVVGMVAVGGYGRGELSPHSDIDLLFLLPYKRSVHAEQFVEFILYILWDLGLKVGHAVRSIDDCIRLSKADMTIRTALLDSRWLCGDQYLFAEMKKRYHSEIIAGSAADYIRRKLAERDERHTRLGEARYVLEPNVKEGKGGLRDLHTLYWLTKYIYDFNDINDLVGQSVLTKEVASRFVKAQAFFWTVRCHLHYLAKRPEDCLTFNLQTEIAKRMHYTDRGGNLSVERFMKHYYLIAKDIGDLTRIICSLLEENQKTRLKLRFPGFGRKKIVDGFIVENERLNFSNDTDLMAEPVKMIRIFASALAHDLDIHPKALSQVTKNLKRIDKKLQHDPEANRLFVEMLISRKNPEVPLRHMNEAGVLGRFVPEFGRVVAQMQYDMYHVFTVDEHTIQAVGFLHRLENGDLSEDMPIAAEIMQTVELRRALYLSVFLHDIAKGRSGNHSELGAEIALKLGVRFGLADEETETVAWLIRNHLLMTQTAFKRDVGDPRTISDFIEVVKSPERLKLLLLLTVADVRAVGPNVWNNWKASLLQELYNRSIEHMSGEMASDMRDARIKTAQEALRELLVQKKWSEDNINAHFAKGYPAYWTLFGLETLGYHAELVQKAEQNEETLTIDWRFHRKHNVTEVTIYVADHTGLFSKIAGAMALSGASVLDAKIITMSNGMALDSFVIQDATVSAFDSPQRLEKLAENISLAVTGKIRLDEALAEKRRDLPDKSNMFRVEPRVTINNLASARNTLVEIHGEDRVGLLYDITAAITRLNLQIASAHISTYGERAVDVFYVKDLFGMRIENERKLRAIKESMFEAIQAVGV